MKLFYAFVSAMFFACNDDQTGTSDPESTADETADEVDSEASDEITNEAESENTEPLSSTAGTLVIGSPNLGALIDAANVRLAEDGQPNLDLPQENVDRLPSGSLGIEAVSGAGLAEGESILAKFEWHIQRIEISTDGKTWVQVYSGDPKPFDVVGGTLGASGITKGDLPPGEYRYAYIEIDDVIWRRADASCADGTMDLDLAGLITTPGETNLLHNDIDVWGIIRDPLSFDDVQASINDSSNEITDPWDYIASQQEQSPKDFLNANGITAPDGFGYDDLFWYLHQPISVLAGEVSPLVFSIIPEDDFLSLEPCDAAPGKPQFIIGSESEIVTAVTQLADKQ